MLLGCMCVWIGCGTPVYIQPVVKKNQQMGIELLEVFDVLEPIGQPCFRLFVSTFSDFLLPQAVYEQKLVKSQGHSHHPQSIETNTRYIQFHK